MLETGFDPPALSGCAQYQYFAVPNAPSSFLKTSASIVFRCSTCHEAFRITEDGCSVASCSAIARVSHAKCSGSYDSL